MSVDDVRERQRRNALHELADELPNAASENQFEAGLCALLRGFTARDSNR
ncbi:hypothetical protein [Mycobacterium paraffinicum]|nr:hypothetical protein [Mycobacterium paraffinicum]